MTTPTLTINPINNGTDVVTAANNTSGVTWTGDETGLDGQQIGLSLDLGYGDSRYGGTVFTGGENGTWSANASHFPFDGIYSATAFAPDAPSANQPADTFIVATHATAFEVVGMAFLDVSQQLVGEPFILSIDQELTAEKAGLQTLLKHDAFPAGPLHKLIADIGKELTALDFTPQSVGYADPKIITKIERIQEKMARFVHDTPALVVQQPDGIGW
jgi:hypothetical protein